MKNNIRNLYILIGVLVAASLVLRFINEGELEQSSLLFVGLPATIAVLMVRYWPKQKSLYGAVFKAITLFLILSGILFGEGIICILMAAPIFYGVGALVVFIYEQLKKNNRHQLYSYVTIPLMLFIAQPLSHWQQKEVIQVKTKITYDSPKSLNVFKKTPNPTQNLPAFFELGFPSPLSISGIDLNPGSTREITFKSMTKGEGKLILEVAEKTDSTLVFKPLSDSTHIAHWLSWKEINVNISKDAQGHDVVQWQTSFECDLFPGWYFKPIERYSVDLMNQHLLHCYFD